MNRHTVIAGKTELEIELLLSGRTYREFNVYNAGGEPWPDDFNLAVLVDGGQIGHEPLHEKFEIFAGDNWYHKSSKVIQMINVEQICQITGAEFSRVNAVLPVLIAALQQQGINYPNVRIAALATIAVESMFYSDAINTNSNDNYTGRGLIQLTGLANYSKYGFLTSLPLVEQPDQAYGDKHGCLILAAYFKSKDIAAYANTGDWEMVRRLVNGGLNGFDKFLEFIWPMLRYEYGYGLN